MKAITLRNIPIELAKMLERKARKEGKSLNRVVIELLLRACALDRENAPVNRDFEQFFGSWTREEAEAFDASLAEQRKVDPDLWK